MVWSPTAMATPQPLREMPPHVANGVECMKTQYYAEWKTVFWTELNDITMESG